MGGAAGDATVAFTFYNAAAPAVVSAVVPPIAPAGELSVVQIVGSNFRPALTWVQFGGWSDGDAAPLRATFIDSSHARCEAPAPTTTLTMPVALGAARAGPFAPGGAAFTSYIAPEVSAVSPGFSDVHAPAGVAE